MTTCFPAEDLIHVIFAHHTSGTVIVPGGVIAVAVVVVVSHRVNATLFKSEGHKCFACAIIIFSPEATMTMKEKKKISKKKSEAEAKTCNQHGIECLLSI
jgi:hypothetical protein